MKTPYGDLLFTKSLGPGMLGAYHTHDCPECGNQTTGAGESLCPECANENLTEMGMVKK